MLIIEPIFFGHHYIYLENIIEQALLKNLCVIIGTQDDKEGNLIKTNILKKFKNPPKVVFFGNMPKLKNINIFTLFIHQIKVRAYYKSIYNNITKNHKIDKIFLPYLDDFAFSLSLLGSPFGDTSYSGISMRQQFHLENKFSKLTLVIKRYLFSRLLKKKLLKNIFIIDPKLNEYIEFSYKNISHKVKYFADPVNDLKQTPKSTSRELLTIPNDNLVVLVFGYLDERKGVDVLINWAIANNTISPVTILLIGTQSPELKTFLNSLTFKSKIQIIVKDEFVSETLEGIYFSVADIVWIAYPKFLLMSSVLIKAAQAETNILFYDEGLISYFANKYGSTLDENSFFIKKGFILNNGLNIKSFSSSNNSFVSDHSWKNAGNIFFNS